MVLPLILGAVGLADTLAMGYSWLTKGELYGLDYYVTGHDLLGEALDMIWPSPDATAQAAEPAAVGPDSLVVAALLVAGCAVAIVVLRGLRQARLKRQARAWRAHRRKCKPRRRSR